ncbi:MAG: DUF3891 family protein [Deltaproteobacteria bacterium]|nr:DUF3891 family protein [Deltaproteobacteria bacterium]
MMVCRYDEARLLLVLQIDHSRVAGLFAAHWGNQDFAKPRPYASMVLAAQEHDSGWWDWEIKPTLNDKGYPPDYIGSIRHLGQGVWLNFYRHGIERAAARDLYAGYNVSMHGEGLLTQGMGLLPYMPDYTVYPEVQQFIREQKAFREKMLADMRNDKEYKDFVSEEQCWTNFKYMEVFDQMAQYVCNRYPFNSTERKNGPTNQLSNTPVPVGPGEKDATLTVDVQDEKNAIVKPYPFDVDPLVVSFPARLVPNRPYSTHEEFLGDFYRGERVTVTYRLHAP